MTGITMTFASAAPIPLIRLLVPMALRGNQDIVTAGWVGLAFVLAGALVSAAVLVSLSIRRRRWQQAARANLAEQMRPLVADSSDEPEPPEGDGGASFPATN